MKKVQDEVRDWVHSQPWYKYQDKQANKFPAGRKCFICENILPRNLKDVCSGDCYTKKMDKLSK